MQRSEYDEDQELNTIFESLLPEYQLFTRRHEHPTLEQLIRLRDGLRKESSQEESPEGTVEMSSNMIAEADCAEEPPTLVKSLLRYDRGRIVAAVTIDDKSIEATIDTGTSRSLVSESLAQTLTTENNRRTVLERITSLVDCSEREITQGLVVCVRMGQQQVTMPMLVLPVVMGDVVLGMDFLCSIEARIELCQAHLLLKANPIAGGDTTPQISLHELNPHIDELSKQNAEGASELSCNSNNLELNGADLIPAPLEWLVSTPNRLLPPEFIDCVKDRAMRPVLQNLKFLKFFGEVAYQVKINKKQQVRVGLKKVD
ncbi:hypothetical protein ACLKA6_009222 [Drosophila palustris]